MMTAAVAVGITACSDDQFSINPDVAGKQSIWQTINNDSRLSEFADILSSVCNSQTAQKATNETYADLLNGDQTFTVWAPVNGSFPYNEYKRLIATGVRDSIYKVEKEFIRNNMTRYSLPITGTDTAVVIDLFNSKTATINNSKLTFKGSQITTANIGASNGTLHITEAPASYECNVYEYMATRRDLDSLNSFIKSYESLKFNESASIQGPTVNGHITWIDSATYISNTYASKYLQASLENEDSLYAMIMPTNNAWKEILAKTERYFKYKETYQQKVYSVSNEGKKQTNEGPTYTRTGYELDSIFKLSTKNAICENLVFNARWQYEQTPINTIDAISKADSLHSTSGTKFKKTGTLNETNNNTTLECDDFTALFGNSNPAKCSNGFAYIADSWNLPFNSYAPVRVLKPLDVLESLNEQCREPNKPEVKTVRYERVDTIVNGTDTVFADSIYKYSCLTLTNSGTTSNTGAYFKLPDVLSCKYDIGIVFVYNKAEDKPHRFRAYIAYDTESGRTDAKGTLTTLKNPNDNEDELSIIDGKSLYNTNYFETKKPYVKENGRMEYTDTVWVARDFEFPISYYGLRDSSGAITSYPTLYFESSFTSRQPYFSRIFQVNAIILKPKEW